MPHEIPRNTRMTPEAMAVEKIMRDDYRQTPEATYRRAVRQAEQEGLQVLADPATRNPLLDDFAFQTKDTNPKDAVGIRRWRQFTTVPLTVLAELGVAMLEGARKYGKHNYRVAGVRSSVYVDAAMGHIMQYWEGEDIDEDSGLSHVTKAIASLVVLRDAMIQDKLVDDRPPKGNLDKVRADLQLKVDDLFDRIPNPASPYTQTGDV